MAQRADLEQAFLTWLRMEKIPLPTRQHKFHPTRKWAFDFAWIDQLVAVEIEGITPQGGRHLTIKGFLGDCEKYEAALRLKWRVYRVPGPWVANGSRMIWRPEVMETVKELLAA